MTKVVVLGAAGFVGTSLCPVLRKEVDVIAVDRAMCQTVDVPIDVTDPGFEGVFSPEDNYSLINLVAARTDFGLAADEYFEANVTATEIMLEALNGKRISFFIHMSSVAELDGDSMAFDSDLPADEAYRVTKSIQSQRIRDFCEQKRIPYAIVYPSAIFDSADRIDTNIGKLRRLARWLPLIPRIPVRKSLTDLVRLCNFVAWIEQTRRTGEFLAIETPVQSVTDIISGVTGKRPIIVVPFLKQILLCVAWILSMVSWVGVDPRLTPNRVTKLFRDTSYQYADAHLDSDSYGDF